MFGRKGQSWLGSNCCRGSLAVRRSDPLGLIADIRRVVSKLAEPIEVSGKLVSIRADIGIVLEAETGRGTDELLADADMALYHAKAKGPDVTLPPNFIQP